MGPHNKDINFDINFNFSNKAMVVQNKPLYANTMGIEWDLSNTLQYYDLGLLNGGSPSIMKISGLYEDYVKV